VRNKRLQHPSIFLSQKGLKTVQDQPNFKAHLFICTRCQYKQDNGEWCSEKIAEEMRGKLKKMASAEFGKSVRVNQAGCLGQCDHGIASVIYPHNEWHLALREGDETKLFERLKDIVSTPCP
jgi:predicted metal-binding protein